MSIKKAELKEEKDPDNPDHIWGSETIYHIPVVYANGKTLEQTAEVVKGQKNNFTFKLDDSRAEEEVKNETLICRRLYEYGVKPISGTFPTVLALAIHVICNRELFVRFL